MKCVSLFSGAGGLDLGLKAAGFEIVASVEKDDDCCKTLAVNGYRNVIQANTTELDFRQLAEPGEIALLVGGPPCQPFSKSALWTHRGTLGLTDPRSSTLDHYLRAVETLQPRAFMLENVDGFAKWGGLEFLQERLAELRSKGIDYKLATSVLNAADFGVPQTRRRFIAVGISGEQPFEFLSPTHGNMDRQRVSAWDALATVPLPKDSESLVVRGRWAGLLPSIPPGQNYLWHTAKGGGVPIFGWRTRFWTFLYKLDPNRPSPTIVASPSQNSGPFHWDNRLLSTNEISRLQTFPADYKFVGSRSSCRRQIGNAVPPLLAEVIGKALIKRLGGTSSTELKYAIPAASNQPEITVTKPVPHEFMELIGEHSAHPGPGLGPRPRPVPKPQEEVSV